MAAIVKAGRLSGKVAIITGELLSAFEDQWVLSYVKVADQAMVLASQKRFPSKAQKSLWLTSMRTAVRKPLT